ncbi:MAG: amidohydrolase family protein [Clostridiaceae bacterium]|nr:amidohydrolase family protein [Clostridiaceae bacterium]
MKIVPKIDIHVHSTPEPTILRLTGDPYATPPVLRKIYDTIGVERGLLLPSGVYGACAFDVISMREARDMVKNYSDTLGWWFCNLSPASGHNLPDTDLGYFLRQLQAMGARGVGEITENRYFDDPYVLNLFRHAEACGMPVTFHIGNPGGGDYGLIDEIGLPRLEKVLRLFPKLTFLGHSQKFWAEIGQCDEDSRKGYPTGPVKPGRVVELLRRYPNLRGDLSAGSGCNAVMRDPAFGYAFLEEFQDRLFYGTDICSPRNIDNPMLRLSGFLDDAMKNGKISYAAYEKISRGNALNLLER